MQRDTTGYTVITLRPSNKGRRARKTCLTRAHKYIKPKGQITSSPPRPVTAYRFN